MVTHRVLLALTVDDAPRWEAVEGTASRAGCTDGPHLSTTDRARQDEPRPWRREAVRLRVGPFRDGRLPPVLRRRVHTLRYRVGGT